MKRCSEGLLAAENERVNLCVDLYREVQAAIARFVEIKKMT